jgi:hypothetical protein
MNSLSLDREAEFKALQKKFEAMEKLNRALQAERTDLLKKAKES